MHKPKILNYINIFRGIAIIFIVLGHTIDISNPFIKRIFMELFAHGTIMFLFISGFLFEYLSKEFKYQLYLKKKFFNVILPYVIISIPGIIYCFLHTNIFSVYTPISQIILYLITGIIHNPPTWYIPLIAVYFVISKNLMFLKTKNILYKFLPLLALFTLFIQRPQYGDSISSDMTIFYKYFIYIYILLLIIVTLHFLFVYVLGMYYSSNKNKIKFLYRNRSWLWILMFVACLIDIYIMKFNLPQNGDISKIFFTLLLLAYLKHYDKKILKHKIINEIFNKIAKYSFGIFFTHWYILMCFNKLFANPYKEIISLNTFLGNISFMLFKFAIVFLLSFCICYIIKFVLNKLGFYKTRFVIGV